MKNSLISLMILLVSHNSFAQDAVELHLGDAAPYPGILFSIPKAQEIRQNEIQLKAYKLINDSLETTAAELEKIKETEDQKVNILLTQNDSLAKDLADARSTSEFTKILWFSLGVVATSVAVWGAHQVVTK